MVIILLGLLMDCLPLVHLVYYTMKQEACQQISWTNKGMRPIPKNPTKNFTIQVYAYALIFKKPVQIFVRSYAARTINEFRQRKLIIRSFRYFTYFYLLLRIFPDLSSRHILDTVLYYNCK